MERNAGLTSVEVRLAIFGIEGPLRREALLRLGRLKPLGRAKARPYNCPTTGGRFPSLRLWGALPGCSLQSPGIYGRFPLLVRACWILGLRLELIRRQFRCRLRQLR